MTDKIALKITTTTTKCHWIYSTKNNRQLRIDLNISIFELKCEEGLERSSKTKGMIKYEKMKIFLYRIYQIGPQSKSNQMASYSIIVYCCHIHSGRILVHFLSLFLLIFPSFYPNRVIRII